LGPHTKIKIKIKIKNIKILKNNKIIYNININIWSEEIVKKNNNSRRLERSENSQKNWLRRLENTKIEILQYIFDI
jgi:hypothetical protein